MLKRTLLCLSLSTLALSAQAHELWLEQDDAGSARVYLGEPDHDELETGDTIAALLPTTRVFVGDAKAQAPLAVREDHLEADLEGSGDVRASNDQVWKPWKSENGEYTAALMHARAGRTETRALMDYELVPVTSGSDQFTLLFKGEPLADQDVMLIGPDKKARELKTNAQGVVTAQTPAKGLYLLASGYQRKANGEEVAGQKVDNLYYGTTTSFVVD